ncbi:MAG: class I SAM-dependent methyltransferase [Desulfobacterales bacterium]|nr:class I SAM-dependent methyltransferase [Desulfobacterales bacterium]
MITVDLDRLVIQPGDRILDVGCGSGRHTALAHQREGVFVAGVDLNMDDLRQARSRLDFHDNVGAHGGGAWGLSAGDVTHLPFRRDAFDVVICSEVLEHIPDQAAAMAELTRVLKPGGDLVVSVPRRLPERICWALSYEYCHEEGGHIRVYKKEELVKRLTAFGLEKRGLHFAHALHTPYWWLKCLVGPSRDDVPLVRLYHRLLVWDMMKHPRVTRVLERLLNPIIGKSIVVYFRKYGN